MVSYGAFIGGERPRNRHEVQAAAAAGGGGEGKYPYTNGFNTSGGGGGMRYNCGVHAFGTHSLPDSVPVAGPRLFTQHVFAQLEA